MSKKIFILIFILLGYKIVFAATEQVVKFHDDFDIVDTLPNWTSEYTGATSPWNSTGSVAEAGATNRVTCGAAPGSNITMRNDVDLSNCVAGTAYTNFTLEEIGNLEASDCLRYQESTDSGATWSSPIEIFCNDQTSSVINSTAISGTPAQYRFRFICENFDISTGQGERVEIRNFNITCGVDTTPPAFSGREPANDSTVFNSGEIQFNITITEVGGSSVNITQLWTNASNGVWQLNQSDNWTDGGKHTFNVTDFGSDLTFVYWAVFANDSLGNFNWTQNFSLKLNQPIPLVGALFVNISLPLNNTEITANTTFTLIANVTCLNADCGTVEGLARYNDSGSSVPNKSISTTKGATPLFVNGSAGGTNVKSVEKYTLEFTATDTSVSANLRNNQNMNNSVPFATMSRNGNDLWESMIPEITFAQAPDRIVATRNTAEGTLTVLVTVVEFDPDSVRVQNGSFAITGSSDTDTIPTAVTVANSGLVFYTRSDDAGDDYDDNSVRGNITSTTQVEFKRETSVASNVYGKWFVFESLDGSFTTQVANIRLTTEDSGTATINSVDTSKTFLIASHSSDDHFDDARDDAIVVNLTDATTVTAYRGNGVTTADVVADINIFVIEFTGNENVQRGSLAYSAGTATVTDTITAVDLDTAMVWNPVVIGQIESDETTEPLESAWNRLNLTGTTTVEGTRGETIGNTRAIYEVVEWVIGGGANPISCGTLLQNQQCQLSFTINASGDVGSHIVIDVSFSSDDSNVAANDTQDHLIKITSPEVVDPTPPSVFDIKPIASITFNVNDTIEIAANVTDTSAVDSVLANVTFPNGTINQLTLTNAVGDKFNSSFNVTSLTGQYNVTFIANDTLNNINSTETTFFSVNAAPSIDSVILNSTLGTNLTSENLTAYPINVTDADNGSVKVIYNWKRNSSSISVLNMPFEGGSTSTFTKDYSDNGNNATGFNGSLWQSDGGHDGFGAYKFDRASDTYFTVPDFNYADNFTITFWFNTSALSGSLWHYVYSHGTWNAVNNVRIYFAESSGELFTQIRDSNDPDISTLSPAGLDDGNWHFYTLTVDKTAGVRLYIDGVLDSSNSTHATDSFNPGTDLYIGGRSDLNTDRHYNGWLDELVVYNRALSVEQISALYNNRSDLIVSQETSIGEVWSVEATPNDGTSDGASVLSNSLTILSSDPSIDSVILNSSFRTNDTSENLTAYPQNVTNLGSGKIIYNWKKNGQSTSVLNMPMDGGTLAESNTKVKDYSGFGNNGIVNGATFSSTGGYDGRGAYTFDGNDYINLGNDSELTSFNDFSLAAWFKTQGSPGGSFHTIIAKGDFLQEWLLLINPLQSSRVRFGVDLIDNDDTNFHSDASNLDDGNWHHVVAIKRGAFMEIYIDGQFSGNDLSEAKAIDDEGLNVTIGARAEGTLNFFNGTIDEVYIFNYSLSTEQVSALYNNRTDFIVSQDTSSEDVWQVEATPNDGSADGSAVLSNNLTVGGTDPILPQIIGVRVDQSSDDAEELISDGDIDFTSTDLELINDVEFHGGDQEVGLRFQNMKISRGATINHAYIQFDADEATSETTNLVIYGQDADNPGTFTTTAFDITNRQKTSASVAWNSIASWAVNDVVQTINIGSIIKEIVDRSNWASGNSIVIIINGSGKRIAEAWDGESRNAPGLVINFSLGTIPNAPQNLNSTMNGTNVSIEWNASSGADYYTVCFADNLSTSFTNCTNVTTTHYLDANASLYVKRFYTVAAANSFGENISKDIIGKQNYTLRRKDGSTTRNLIGLYLNSSYLKKAKDLLDDATNATDITRWNATSQTAITCNDFTCPDICTSTTCNFNLVAGEAYRVNIDNNSAWTLTGLVYNKINITLIKNDTSTGLNWIAMYGNTTLTNADGLMKNITNVAGSSVSDAVSFWNSTSQKWYGWISLRGGRGKNFSIEPHRGYSVSVTQNVNWTQK